MHLIAVFTTTATRQEAQNLARSLVERNLAACAQISEIESFYRWQGQMQQAPEFRVLFKTTSDRYVLVEEAIRELHSYEVPAIWAMPVERSFELYEQWLREGSTPSP